MWRSSSVCRTPWMGVLSLVVAAVVVASVPTQARAASPGYEPLPAALRLVDTRPGETTVDGRDAGIGLRPASSSLQVQVAGRAGIPADAATVVLNVTAVDPLGPGFITVHATGTARPLASNLNYEPGETVANTVIVPVGSGGDVTIYTLAATHLVIDAAGSFPTGSASMIDTAARLVDTRPGETTVDGRDAGIGLRPASSSLQVQVAGRAGIPADAATVVLNVTAVDPLGPGFITVHATGTARPLASNLNYEPGETVANTVIVPVGSGGDVTIYTLAATHLVIDAAGSFPTGSASMIDTAARLVDTRPGETTVDGRDAGIGLRPASSSLQVQVAGRAGIPADAATVVLNVTAVTAYDSGHLTVHPTGTTRPLASNLNYGRGQTVANTVFARIGTGGDVCIFSHAGTHLVVDVAGWLPGPPPPPSGPTCPAVTYGEPISLDAYATDINNFGVLVGSAGGVSGGGAEGRVGVDDLHAVWWPTPASSPRPLDVAPGELSRAVAVNDAGRILVSVGTPASPRDALVVDPVSGSVVEMPLPDWQYAEAKTMNDRGEVIVFVYVGPGGPALAFVVWNSATGAVDTVAGVGPLPGFSDINNRGHVVGGVRRDDEHEAFLWDRSGPFAVHFLDHTGWNSSSARAINDRGQILGSVWNGPTDAHVAVWDDLNASPRLLDGLSSAADINDAGQIIGRSSVSGVDGVWDLTTSQFIQLPSAAAAFALNDVGQVLGWAGDHGALWNPQ